MPGAQTREAAFLVFHRDGDSTHFAPVLVTVKVPEEKVARSRRVGIVRPDYSEKSQSRRTSASSSGDIVKVDVTIAPGLQVKDPSKRPKSATSLDVFSASAAGALPAIWAKLPQSLVLRGEDKGWRKITKRCKDFLIGQEQRTDKTTQGTRIVVEQLTASNSTILNQELAWGSTDWVKEAKLIKSLLSQTNKCND